MNCAVVARMVGADILKLRRHRSTTTTAAVLSIGITLLYLAVVLSRDHGQLPGAQTLLDGTSLMGLYFGSFAAILIGTEAGTADVAAGVFRDLAATGRSRVALFLTRIPAAVAVSLVFTLSGLLLTVAVALAFHGAAGAPGIGLILRSGGWVALSTAVLASLAVGIGSATGSRSVTLTTLIGLQTVVTGIIYLAGFLGTARFLDVSIALCRFLPGPAIGSHSRPGSTNALVNYKLSMPALVAALVIIAWTVIPAVAGAYRTRSRDV